MTTSQYMTRKYRNKLSKLLERTNTDNYTQHKEDLMKKWSEQITFWEGYKAQK